MATDAIRGPSDAGAIPPPRPPAHSGAIGRVSSSTVGRQPADEIDPVAALAEFSVEAGEGLSSLGLADALLDFVAPRPRRPELLNQQNIAPLLGMAAEALTRASADGDIASLGARAIAQELRTHRDIAERRASLVDG